ncbi:hypothetical protein MMC14_007782 [Varicellaria rhodocarpa]|nr:hypothetical protein [Varicellaria rhodocarpa]
MSSSTPILSQHFLAENQVRIADLVLSTVTPWNDFRSFPETLAEGETSVVDKSIGQVFAEASAHGAKAHVGGIIGAAMQSREGAAQSIQSMSAQCVRLKNSGDKFEDVCCKDEAIRSWLEKHILDRGEQVYMVVGEYFLTDAQVQQVESLADAKDARAITTSLDSFSAGASTNRTRQGYQHTSFNAPGRQIFAEYRQVRLRWALRKRINKSFLAPNQWHVFLGSNTGQRTAFKDEEDHRKSHDNDNDNDDDDDDDDGDVEEGEPDMVVADLVDDLKEISFESYDM